MDRLTKRIDGGVDDFGMPLVSTYEIVDKTPGLANARVRCQLGRYEDTGLTPDEIVALQAEVARLQAASEQLRNENVLCKNALLEMKARYEKPIEFTTGA